ncbi:hypothetical protein SK128_016580 [Halocaridina rubra]|uniref:Uncharacterized protein n=1 Tax=Halocaridina rubra TaxID=373956 RepID=A0AAN9AAL9_HALRR
MNSSSTFRVMILLVWLCVLYGVTAKPQDNPIHSIGHTHVNGTTLEEEARVFLEEIDRRETQECTAATFAAWQHDSDITESHRREKEAAQLKYAAWHKTMWQRVQDEWKDRWENLNDPFLKRQFKFHSVLGVAALPKNDLEKYNSLLLDMETMYSTAKICDYKSKKKCDLSLEPDLTRILHMSRDYKELEHVWKQWRHNSGRLMRDHYKLFVRLANKAAKLNEATNLGEQAKVTQCLSKGRHFLSFINVPQ